MEEGGSGGFVSVLLGIFWVIYLISSIYYIINSAIKGNKDEKSESRNFLIVALAMMTCPIAGGFLFGLDGVMCGIMLSIPVGFRVNAWHKKEETLDVTYLLVTIFTFAALPWAVYSIIGYGSLFIFSFLFLAPISRRFNELRFMPKD